MTEQNPDSNLKTRDYRKWVEGQSIEALLEQVRDLKKRQNLLRRKIPIWEQLRKAIKEVLKLQEEWDLTQISRDPWQKTKDAKKREAKLAAMGPAERALAQAEIDWAKVEATMRFVLVHIMNPQESEAREEEVARHLESELMSADLSLEKVQWELNVRRNKELSPPAFAKANRRPIIDPDSDLGRRRKIIEVNPGLKAKAYCLLWENSDISVPSDPCWNAYRPNQWVNAYKKDKKLRCYIGSLVSRDKKA
jgi:hypothetical protein